MSEARPARVQWRAKQNCWGLGAQPPAGSRGGAPGGGPGGEAPGKFSFNLTIFHQSEHDFRQIFGMVRSILDYKA